MSKKRLLSLGTSLAALGLVLCFQTSLTRAADDDKKQDQKKQDEKKLDANEVLLEVRGLFQAGDAKKALAKTEALVKQQPENRDARLIAAQLNHTVGMEIAQNGKRKEANKYLYASAKHMRAVHKQSKGKLPAPITNLYAVAIYNEACSLAVDGKKEKALKVLDESIEAGFDQLEVLEKDEDFKLINNEKKFKELVEKLKKKIKDRKKKAELDEILV